VKRNAKIVVKNNRPLQPKGAINNVDVTCHYNDSSTTFEQWYGFGQTSNCNDKLAILKQWHGFEQIRTLIGL
jgi:hypothetical protein